MFCEKCGAQIADNLKFCPKCGAKQIVEPVVQQPINPPDDIPGGVIKKPENRDKPNKKSKKPLIITIAILVVILAIAIFGACSYFFGSAQSLYHKVDE